MRRSILIVCLALLLISGACAVVITAPGAAAAQPAKQGNTSEQSSGSIEEWAHTRGGPWMACAILGAYHYVRYLLDSSSWVRLVVFSRYLEQGECFWRDLERAAEIYREGAKAGKEVHALYLGYLYLKGLGVERNVKEARRWFDLGVLYQIDANLKYQVDQTKFIMGHRGMPPELIAAMKRGRKKLDGDGYELFMLAQSLRLGTDGMAKNLVAAASLFRTAWSAKRVPPRFRFHYYELLWVNAFRTSDRSARESEVFRAARGLLNLAALYEHRRAEKMLAEFFVSGEWVPKNFFAAYVLYRAAQRNGLDVAAEIDRIRPNLSAEQISEVEDVFRERKTFAVIQFLRRFDKLLE